MRVAKAVDRPLLESCVAECESSGPLKNRSILYESVTQLYNSKTDVPLTASVVMLRIRDWGIACQTPFGKRGRGGGFGREKGVPLSEEQKAAMKAGRAKKNGKNHPKKEAHLKALKEKLVYNKAERYIPLAEKAGNGNKRAAIKLFCLECMGYCVKEVRDCTEVGCPFYCGRPFQKFTDDQAADLTLASAELMEGLSEEEEMEAASA